MVNVFTGGALSGITRVLTTGGREGQKKPSEWKEGRGENKAPQKIILLYVRMLCMHGRKEEEKEISNTVDITPPFFVPRHKDEDGATAARMCLLKRTTAM